MSASNHQGLSIFHFFCFFLLGILFRQVGFMLKLKAVHHVPLFVTGTLLGIHYLKAEEGQAEIPLLSKTGCIWFYNVYIPIYYFLATFNLDRDALNIRLLSYTFLVCLPIWFITIFSVIALTENIFDMPFHRKELAIMTMVTLVPDVHMTKLFIASKFTFASQDVCSLIQFECILASCISSVLYMLFLTGSCDDFMEFTHFAARTLFAILVAFLLGNAAASAVFRMHYDNINQISIVMVFIYLTFGIACLGEASGDLAVVMVGAIMMESKPRLGAATVDMINRFFEIIRFGIVSSFGIIFGIVFTVRFHHYFQWEDLLMSSMIYCISYSCRFLIITGISLVTGKVFFQSMPEAFTVSASHLRGVFSMVLILPFRKSHLELPMENNRLFVLAGFQIALSIFVSTTMASFMATIQRRYTFDREKIMMLHQAVRLMNSYRDSLVRMLRRMTFTADADWEIVIRRTMIRASFLRLYEYNQFMSKAYAQTEMKPNDVRKNAIKDLLRLQRRFLEEQFRHGTLGGRSAAFFASYVRKCLHRKELMSAKKIINSMAPKKSMLIIHRDLAHSLVQENASNWKPFFVMIVLCTDLYLLVFATFTRMFFYTQLNQYILDISIGFGLFIAVLSVIAIVYSGNFYLHLYARSMWNWISWLVFLCSVGAILLEVLPGTLGHKIHIGRTSELHSITDVVAIPFSSGLTLLRALLLSCCLQSVQNLLASFVTLVLDKATFNQCDACQGFLQVSVDTAQIVDNRMGNTNLASGVHEILHTEILAARQYLGIMNMLTPDVLAAVKARIACRLVLISQKNIITHKVDHNAMLDQQEIELLNTTLQDKLKTLTTFVPALTEPSDEEIIQNIGWISGSRISYYGILLRGEGMKLSVNDVILAEGAETPGVFLILDGVVRVESVHSSKVDGQRDRKRHFFNEASLAHDHQHYHNISKGGEVIEISDFCTRGAVIGEFPLITGKKSHKTYRCITAVKLMAIPKEKLFNLMGGRPHSGISMSRLEHSLWVTIANRFAARLIQTSTTYHLLSKRQIYMMMEDAYLIDASEEKQIDLTKFQRAVVILLYGEIYSPASQQVFYGPCILPSNLLQLTSTARSQFGKTSRTVIFILRSYKSKRLGKGMPMIKDPEIVNIGDNSSITISSGSTDGVPYIHPVQHTVQGQLEQDKPDSSGKKK